MREQITESNPPQRDKQPWPAWWARLGGKERRLALQISGVLLLGLALMYGSGLFSGHSGTSLGMETLHVPQATEAAARSEEDLEAKLLRILSAVEGAGKVQVALSFGESASAEYAYNSDITENTSEETDDNGTSANSSQRSESQKLAEINAAPVLIKQSMPKLSGAVIVAEGADDAAVREKLHKAARTLLGLPAHRIVILKSND